MNEQKLTEISKRLKKVEIWLRTNDMISRQYEIGEMIGANKGTISKAMSGDPKYLTRNFVKRLCDSIGIISFEWLWNGTGEMLVESGSRYSIDNNQSYSSSLSDIAHTYNISTDAREKNNMSELLTAIVQLNNRVTSLESYAASIASELSESKRMLTTLYQLLTNPNIKQS